MVPADRRRPWTVARARPHRAREDVLRAAIAAGALTLARVAPEVLPLSQPNLVHTRGAVWGRLTVMRLAGLPTPRYRNLPMLPSWLRLTPQQKLRSTAGTLRRIRTRGLRRRRSVTDTSAPAAGSST